MDALIWLILTVLRIYVYIIFAEVILSLLITFNVINPYNRFVTMVRTFTYALTEPALRPIRGVLQRFLPNMGGIDISPMILLLLIYFLQRLIVSNAGLFL